MSVDEMFIRQTIVPQQAIIWPGSFVSESWVEMRNDEFATDKNARSNVRHL